MRHFQVNTLCSEDATKTVFERVFNTGEIEYWAVMNVGFQNGPHRGNAQMPFKIEVNPPVFPGMDANDIGRMRREAFENFQTSFEACREGAEQQVKQQINAAARREQSKIILANAAGAVQ